MKNKFKFLVRQSLGKKINTKWFKITNVIILVLMILLANMDRIISYFGGDFNDEVTVYVEDHLGLYDTFKETFDNWSKMLGNSKNIVINKNNENIEDFKNTLQDNNKILLVIDASESDYVKAEIISYDEIDTITNQLIMSSLNSIKTNYVAGSLGLTPKDMEDLSKPVPLLYTKTNEEANGENKDLVAEALSLIVILPCFFLIVMLVQMIGAEINEEKSSRSMEIIISNVPAKVHFLAKVVSSTTFVLIQGILVLVYGAFAYLSRILIGGTKIVSSIDVSDSLSGVIKIVEESGVIELLIRGLPFIIILFIFSFLLYAIVAGVLASVTTSNEDFQQLQTPIMLIIMVGYYLAIMAVTFEGATFIKAVAYIPMLSFLLAPVLYLLGQISLMSLFLISIITIITTFIVFKYGLRIYKEGILNYSSSKLWSKMLHSMLHKWVSHFL